MPEVLAVEGEVLVTRWIDGTPLSRVIASGTQDDRDRCGTALVRLFTSGPARARRLHGDPHPGNFRLMDDGRLGVLDFGSNQPMPHGWPARLGPLLAAGRDGDAAQLHRIAASAHLLRPDDVTPAALLDAARPLPAAAAQRAVHVHPQLAAGADPASLRPPRRRPADPAEAVDPRRATCCCSGWPPSWSASSAR